MPVIAYGDISPYVAGYKSKQFIERNIPELVTEQFGLVKPLPSNSTKTMVFRGYDGLDPTPKYLVEGVSPASSPVDSFDVTVTLVQMGDVLELTDVVHDTHDDQVLNEFTGLLSEQSPQMLEAERNGKLVAGTNVYYANGLIRSDVNTTITKSLVRRAVRGLKRQRVKTISRALAPSTNFNTTPVPPSYIGFVPTDCINSVRDLDGFIPVQEYSQPSPYPTDFGSTEDVRWLHVPMMPSFPDAGGDAGLMLSSSGVKADVYSILIVGAGAYATVPLRGKQAVKIMVLNPNTPRGGDALGQKGSVGWKTMAGTVILKDSSMVRLEVAALD